MNSLLLIIDLQKSFINENTIYVIKNIQEKMKQFNHIIFTRFINEYDSIYYKKLNYKGCLLEEDKQIVIPVENNMIIDKKIYTAYCDELVKYIKEKNINKIYLCGIDIECCVLKTALDLFENDYEVYIIKDCCACTFGEERKQNAIDILLSNIGEESIV